MMNTSTFKRLVCGSAVAAALLLMSGAFTTVYGQRDPFAKPDFMKPKTPGAPGTPGAKPKVEVNYGPPAIEARIEYFKRLREAAAANGATLPKVTSVLTLNEMAVTGIFKTPRGYAAMVEATPIKLSYTIYPGEKFFDGQLVAVEENRLVFRKVTKVGEKKFVASVENKPLRQFTMKAQVEGTAPSQPSDKPVPVEVVANKAPVEAASGSNPPPETVAKDGKASAKPASNPFLSPLDEMNKQVAEQPKNQKEKAPAKKPAKVAKNK
jgi:hypothetical protein